MKKNKMGTVAITVLMALTLGACGSKESEPKKVDASEKTEQVSKEKEAKKAASKKTEEQKKTINFTMVKGFASIGSVNLMHENQEKNTKNQYNMEVAAAPDEVRAKLASGEADIAALPTNMAATLYNKTNGNVQILAVNTLGVVKLITSDDSVKTLADLKGKTVAGSGLGAIPEYTFNYILNKNGIDPKTDLTIDYRVGHEEVAGLVGAKKVSIATIPEPTVSQVLAKNPEFHEVADLNAEWQKIEPDVLMSQGCVVAKTDFIKKHPEQIKDFMEEYKASCNKAVDDVQQTAKYTGEFDIMPTPIAEKAIPKTNQVFISGDELEKGLTPFFQILFDANPKSVGGKMPASDFYYKG